MSWVAKLLKSAKPIRSAESSVDAALGCLLGACVGDAAGATLEFLGREPTPTEVEKALRMPGGGVLQVAPGQITDDGELMICLAQALCGKKQFDREAVARQYAEWIRSRPFDMGFTTRRSLGCFDETFGSFQEDAHWRDICERQGYAAAMSTSAAQYCMGSKANGSLMRIAPLGVWGHRFSVDEVADFARQDSSLSHPNESCCHATACYVIAVASLMRYPGDGKRAFNDAKRWAIANANPEVRGWLHDAEQRLKVPCHPQAGFIRIGFTHAFIHLLAGTDYVSALRETLACGGDTDTNACIVGGLIGAACGAKGIPDYMKQSVLNCDTCQGAHPRPEFLQASQIPQLAEGLLDVRC